MDVKWIRRRLLMMSTLDTLTFGRLTVRLFTTTASRKWQITSAQTRQEYSYPKHVEYDWLEGGRSQLSVANDALNKAVAYILANYQSEKLASAKGCIRCGSPVNIHAKYCGPSCREMAYRERKRKPAA